MRQPSRTRTTPAPGGSLDHLFLDADGVPTLVEVKRSSDTRIRREVVGQMLDYAANAAHWNVDQLRGWLDARCKTDDLDPDEILADHTPDIAEFWEQVRTNLAAGRMRLVFVADEIPPALRQIVEFLNEQMTECEVIAIEVRQYLGDGQHQTIIVPRVLGQTEAAKQVKGKREIRHWDRKSVLLDLAARTGPAQHQAAMRLLEWGDRRPDLTWAYGHGAVAGSAQFGIHEGECRIFPFVIYSSGWLELPFVRMAAYEPFADHGLRDQYRQKLNTIDGIDLSGDAINKRPSVSLHVLTNEGSAEQFLAVVGWALEQRSALS